MSTVSLLYASPGHIRSRLFRDLVSLILFTVSLLILVNWYLIGGLKRDFASSQIVNANALVRDEILRLIGPVEQQLLITRDGVRRSGLDAGDVQDLNERFGPVMLHMDQIAGALFADDAGAEYFLLHGDVNWVGRVRPPGENVSADWTTWDSRWEVQKTHREELDYDPRSRPWFSAAVDAGYEQVTWSAPYIFHSLQVPGVTASIAWEAAGGVRVLALDVTLDRIIDTLERLPLGDVGRGFLFGADGGVYVPGQEATGPVDAEGSRFFSADERLGGPLLFDAVAAWKAAGRPAEGMIRFTSEGTDWWGGFMALSSNTESAWIGVALPTSETFGILRSRWQVLALAAILIIALGVGLVLLLMRKYSRQLRDLPKLSIDPKHYERDVQDLIANGEDMHLEFKSTMRTNLHTGKPGKEIELAWLKGAAGFMNAEGGILLLGVADDGTLVGLQEDKFENEDKCRLHFKNLFNQHLGAENARFVRFGVYELEGKRIGAVECERADAPVFLRNKNAESFLIRNGPSNIELSVSRAVKYIRGRF